jgi:hypothetical protein
MTTDWRDDERQELEDRQDELLRQIHDLRLEVVQARAALEVVHQDCLNLTEKVIPNLVAERDEARALVRALAAVLGGPDATLVALRGHARAWQAAQEDEP